MFGVLQVVYKNIVELLDQRQKELLNGTIKLYDVLLTTVTVLQFPALFIPSRSLCGYSNMYPLTRSCERPCAAPLFS
jgi:hypothetical protein